MNETAWVREERPAFKQPEAPDVARVRKLMLEAERVHSEICEEFKRRYLAIVNEHYCEIAWEVAEGKPVTQTPELVALAKAMQSAFHAFTQLDNCLDVLKK